MKKQKLVTAQEINLLVPSETGSDITITFPKGAKVEGEIQDNHVFVVVERKSIMLNKNLFNPA